jgi:AcrR family transcriptional regulator
MYDRSVVFLLTSSVMTDGRLARGTRTRTAVLDAAVATASVHGLEGMSLGRLAGSLGVSKSGLFAHWPDKERLQLEVVAHARRQWIEHIVQPALAAPRGLPRLWALHENRLHFYEQAVLPGGCFFAAVGSEFDDRPGPVRDAIAEAVAEWFNLLTDVARQAVAIGHLPPTTDPAQLAFEIKALGEVVAHCRLMPATHGMHYARRGVLDRLRALATDPSVLPEE